MMKAIQYALMALMLLASVTAFKVETMSYKVDTSNTGLSGSILDTTSYEARMLWEPFYPSSDGYTTLYYLHSGYFEMFFVPPAIDITLVYPGNNAVINDANITFTHYTSANGTVASCNLLVWYDSTLTINSSVAYPGTGQYNWTGYPLPEDDYTWQVQCSNLALETFSSSMYAFSVDRTAPVLNVNAPLNITTPYTEFDFDILENHPSYLTINVNGTEYNFSYVNGSNTFSPSLPTGIFSWNVTVYDAAGNNATYGPYQVYVNPYIITITNIKFSPDPILNNVDNTLSALINGIINSVIVSVQVNNGSWMNFTVTSFSGTGPYQYYKILDSILYGFNDIVYQKWYVLDNASAWHESGIFSSKVQNPSSGGRYPTKGDLVRGNLTISPSPLQIKKLNGILFDVYNNRTESCELLSARVEDSIGYDLKDRFKVQTLTLSNFTIEPNKTMTLQIKPTGWTGISGNGRVIIETKECGMVEAPLGVEIYFVDLIIDNLNTWTSDIVSWFSDLIEAI